MNLSLSSFSYSFSSVSILLTNEKDKEERERFGSALHDLGADAVIREDLQQEAVRQSAVNEVHALHAFLERPHGTLDLRTHALVDDALLLEVVDLADLERGN